MDSLLLLALTPLERVGYVKLVMPRPAVDETWFARLEQIAAALGHSFAPPAQRADEGNQLDEGVEAQQVEVPQADSWLTDLEGHLTSGGISAFGPEDTGDAPQVGKVSIFQAACLAMAVRVDCEVWCFASLGAADCWPREAPMGGLPGRIGACMFQFCGSTCQFFADAEESKKLPDGANESAKSSYLAQQAHTLIQAQVDAFAAEDFAGLGPVPQSSSASDAADALSSGGAGDAADVVDTAKTKTGSGGAGKKAAKGKKETRKDA
jgi:hypothetical protein